ncbi:HD-GYP domain-containing protein [Thermotoga sp.]|uniref:HD-GYP domain-containing protein n=1 Tax=Thermotoga sp. TaxID=28240 RepID=UPI0025E68CEC|nr:HD-GYP domain-containing protein [Thermotoga sp.]MCD6551088.1 HD-GYP domain-containing protein [Thermotoga sp.]
MKRKDKTERNFLLYSLTILGVYLGLLSTNIHYFKVHQLRLVFIFFLTNLFFDSVNIKTLEFTKGKVETSAVFIVNIFAAVLLNPFEASLVAATSGIFLKLIKVFLGEKYPISRYIFNFSQLAITTYITSLLFHGLSGQSSLQNTFAVLLSTFVYFFINNVFVFLAVYILSRDDIRETAFKVLSGPVTSMALMIPVIAVIYILYQYIGFIAIPVSLAAVLSIQIGNYYRYRYYEAKLEHLKLLAKSLEEKDEYTRGHSERVAELAKKMARKLGFSPKKVDRIYNAAFLHDIGKIGIPDHILKKPTILSKEEMSIVKNHPVMGEDILREVDIFNNRESKWVRHHHERWDGTGYPDGLKGREIPLPSRIIAVADVYEALTSDRPYRKALTEEQAREIMIKQMSGTVLDPDLVKLLFEILDEEEKGEEKKDDD